MKEWFTARDLAGLPDMPSNDRNVRLLASRRQWKSRRRQKGKGYEYHLSSLPEETQAELLIRFSPNETPTSSSPSQASPSAGTAPQPATAPAASYSYDREALWAHFERKGSKLKARARNLLEGLTAALALIEQEIPATKAWSAAARARGVSVATLRRAYNRCAPYRREDWLAALVPGYAGRTVTATCDPAAWDFFLADYLRLERPSANACYERLKRAAAEHGWAIPSVDALLDRVKREVPQSVRVLKREGEQALMRLYPAQQRTVRDLRALEWVNGDGYRHNVFVRWPDGTIARPKTWFWQDVMSRKVLTYRTDLTEHTDMLRLSFGALVERYGVPEHVTIDNTRAAANKWLTGGTPNRYRFKVKEEDPLGILVMLGVQVHWTSVHGGRGHGQAKPVERAFGVGGIGEVVDKHPSFAGAWTGNNPNAKPEDYGSRAIPLVQFLQVLEAEVAAWNARPKRRTELCGGVHSFDDVFNRSYASAPVRRVTEAQRRLWLLAAEGVRVQRDGTITLDAGSAPGAGRNRYFSPALHEHLGQKVVVRFDPDDLHGDVYVYTLDGAFIDRAACIEDAGFGDTTTGRQFARERKRFMKAAKQAAQAEIRMSAIEAAGQLPGGPQDSTPAPKVVQPLRPGKTIEPPAPVDPARYQALVDSFEQSEVVAMDDPIREHAYWLRIGQRLEQGEAVSPAERDGWEIYRNSQQYQSRQELFESFGLTAEDCG